MARDDVPSELVADLQRALEIDAAADAPILEGRARQGLRRGLYREPIDAVIDRGEADARASDRGAEREIAEIEIGLDDERRVAAGTDFPHGADIDDDAGKQFNAPTLEFRAHPRQSPRARDAGISAPRSAYRRRKPGWRRGHRRPSASVHGTRQGGRQAPLRGARRQGLRPLRR